MPKKPPAQKNSSDLDPSFFGRFGVALKTVFTAPVNVLMSFWTNLREADERLSDSEGTGDYLIGLLTLPWRLLVGCFSFVVFSWASTRSGVAFILGMPAVLGMAGLFFPVLISDMVRSPETMEGINEAYFRLNVEKRPEHPEWAEIFARRLVEENPTEPRFKFMLASVLDKGEHGIEAKQIMQHLAPPDVASYGPAHLWQANKLIGDMELDEKLSNPDPGALRQFELAKKAMPESIEPDFQLARMYELYASRFDESNPDYLQNLELANEHYDQVLNRDLDLGGMNSGISSEREASLIRVIAIEPAIRVKVKLSKIQPEVYKPEAVKNYVYATINQLLPAVKLRSANNPAWWRILINCALEIEDYQKTEEIIKAGQAASTNPAAKGVIRQMAASTLVIQAKRIKDFTDQRLYNLRLKVLCQAISINSNDPDAYPMLLEFIGDEEQPDQQVGVGVDGAVERAVPLRIDWLRSQGAGTKYSGVINALIGIHEIANGDVAIGRKNWQIGEEFDPRTKVHISKMLLALNRPKSPKLPNMIDMMTLAIEMFADIPELYFVRATYLKSNQRFEEAIVDYEQYFRARPSDYGAAKSLSLCYEKTGNEEKREEFDNEVESILAQMDESQLRRARQILKKAEDSF